METVLIVIHLLVVFALVVVVLLQRSEGGALGMGGGGGGVMSARGAANALSRTTAILAAAFFATSISLGILARINESPTDVLDRVPVTQDGAGGNILDQITPESERQSVPAAPGAPKEPGVPTGQ